MAHAALTGLLNTISCTQSFSRLSFLFPYYVITFDCTTITIQSLKKHIKRLDRRSRSKRYKALDAQLRDAARGLEDVLDSALLDLIQSDWIIGNERLSVYEMQLRQGIDFFLQTAWEIEEEYCKMSEVEDEDDEEEDEEEEEEEEEMGKKGKVVGSNTQNLITKILHQVNASERRGGEYELRVVSIVGIVGSGRSILGFFLFTHEVAVTYNYLRAWVRIGPKYDFKQILANILSQIDEEFQIGDERGEEELMEDLHTILKHRMYMIVLEDVRETGVWEYLKKLFPNESNGSRVILITHVREVADFAQSFNIYLISLMSNEESWDSISRVLYREERRCPTEVEEARDKIVKKCEGVFVEIAKYAGVLYGVPQTADHWNKVAEEMKILIDNDAYDEISEVRSFRNLYTHKLTLTSLRIQKWLLDDDFNASISPNELPSFVMRAFGSFSAVNDIQNDVFLNKKMFLNISAVVGMAGIGKTRVAREIFDDSRTLTSFDHRVWLRLGPKYKFDKLVEDILAQLDPNIEKMHVIDDESSVKHLRSILYSKRCFIVLDDVWHKDLWSYLRKFVMLINCEVLLTTRLKKVPMDEFRDAGRHRIHEMRLLNKEESWSLLKELVFGEEMCPHDLEKPGKLIAENCDGLPLMIVTVGSLLSKADKKTIEYWYKVEKINSSLFEMAYLKISKDLYPSYKDLAVKYRACFLYMAGFYLKYKIPISKLFVLYDVEGLIEIKSYTFLYFIELLRGKSLILMEYSGELNNCRLHSVFWHFCVREARNDRLFHVLNRIDDSVAEDMVEHRRLCIQNNVLFAIKDVYNSMASVLALRSLLCFAPPHPYQVPICLESDFLKVVDALTIRFYEFPVGILRLVLLRYLALNYNGDLPGSISKLWNLAFLIVHPHMSIRFPGHLSYLPMVIWDMKELKHLQIMGSNLLDPRSGVVLEKLESLLDVRAETCRKSIFERIPNLKKLGIHIELEPDHTLDPMFSFDHISHLQSLEFFKCVVVNPEFQPTLMVKPVPFSILPSSLREVTLSGLGYHWEHIRPIALLPHLEDLKLQCFAFRGAEWTMQKRDFRSLRYLLLEDTDLVKWRADEDCYLYYLEYLNIRHCFKLKEIPWQCFDRYCNSEIIDCNPSCSETMPKNEFNKIKSSWVER